MRKQFETNNSCCMSVAAGLQANKCDRRIQWLMMTGKHVKGRKEGRETVRCGCKCEESYRALELIFFP